MTNKISKTFITIIFIPISQLADKNYNSHTIQPDTQEDPEKLGGLNVVIGKGGELCLDYL